MHPTRRPRRHLKKTSAPLPQVSRHALNFGEGIDATSTAYTTDPGHGTRSGLAVAASYRTTDGYTPMRDSELHAIHAYRQTTADLDNQAGILTNLGPASYRLAAAIAGPRAADQLIRDHQADISRWNTAHRALAAGLPRPSDQARAYLAHEQRLLAKAIRGFGAAIAGYATHALKEAA